ncbi:MAG TPA: OsmC family protein [Cyclobacteriaceae bacterium]|nr:OsmC family protein [Cyclobacteriaceae bacterium]
MKHNMSLKDRSFRLMLALVAIITFESDFFQPTWDIVLLVSAAFLAVTAVINYCPIYAMLGIRRWELVPVKVSRLAPSKAGHHYYHVNVSWNNDRRGVVCSPELNNAMGKGCIEVATPPQFPKGIPGVWSPEHLFTAAVSSCVMTTFLAVAEKHKLKFISFSCPSEGKLERKQGTWMMTEVTLHPTVILAQDEPVERGKEVVEESIAACLISNSIKSRIVTKPVITVARSLAETA